MRTFGALMAGLFAPAALTFLAVGIRGLTGGKPLVFPSRRMLGLVVLCFLPGLAAPLSFWSQRLAHPGAPLPPLLLLPLLVYAAILALVYRLLKGYTIMGATDEALAAALRRALDLLHLAYEESLNRLRLPAHGIDLKLHVQPGTGVGRLVTQPEDPALLDRIAAALRETLTAAPGDLARTGLAVFLAVGCLFLLIAAALATALP